ncbi:MAG: topoisomerase C-terminal repeat-containing protein, partial [Myxococcota bacterium]
LERDDASTLPVRPKQIPEGMEYCASLLPRTVCKREITREEALEFYEKGQTPLLEGFTSKKGRPFAAILFRKEETGRHGFEFPPRGGDGDGKKKTTTKKKAATKKKATKKKATTKKKVTAKKKVAAKKKAPAKKKKVAAKKKAAPKKKPVTAAPPPSAEATGEA